MRCGINARWQRGVFAAISALVLLGAACGDGRGTAPPGPGAAAPPPAQGAVSPSPPPTSSTPSALQPVRVAFAGPSPSVVPLWLAQAEGLFQQHGLTAEVFTTQGGSRGLQVLVSGEIDAMHVGLFPTVQAVAGGAGVRMMVADANRIPFILFAAPDIQTPADLRDKRIGISSFASESDSAVTLALRELGLRREDVTVLQIGGAGERLAAVQSGHVQAVPLPAPVTVQAEKLGLRPLLNLAERDVPWIFDGLVVSQAALQHDRDKLKRLLQAYLEGGHRGLQAPDKARAVIGQQFKTEDPEAIEAAYRDFARLFIPDGRPDPAGIRNVLREVAASDSSAQAVRPEDVVDTSLLDELARDGFFQRLGVAAGPVGR
jgi:NitT/TauT family transport system substrate-binding protein